MSMSRARYDRCWYRQDEGTNANALTWQLDPIKFNHDHECRMKLGIVGGSGVSLVAGNLVDLENDLRCANRPNTHCPWYKYLPTAGYVQGKDYIMGKTFPVVDTHLIHLPTCQLIDY